MAEANEVVAPIALLAQEMDYEKRLPMILVTKGAFSIWFEEEYIKIIDQERDLTTPEYDTYLMRDKPNQVHNGYFSIDKKGKIVDPSVKRGKEDSDDVSAYDLIKIDKERLLDFEEPTRFIFSHSALKEGWDNPNVYQI